MGIDVYLNLSAQTLVVIVVMYFINKLYREEERAEVHNNKVNMIFKIQKNNAYCKYFYCEAIRQQSW